MLNANAIFSIASIEHPYKVAVTAFHRAYLIHICIDLTIVDKKYHKAISKVRIKNYRKICPNKGIFTGTDKIFLFLNTVFLNVIEKAWIEHVMLNALRGLDKRFFSK